MDVNEFIALTLRASTSLMDIVKEPGVADLQPGIKSKFAQAVKAERSGNFQRANELLDIAVELELAA